MSFSRLSPFGLEGQRAKYSGFKPTSTKLKRSLENRSLPALIGHRIKRVILHPVDDRHLVEEFIRLCPKFTFTCARSAKATLLERRFDPDKISHLLLSWWKLKLLKDSFSRHKRYVKYIHTAYQNLFFLENQEVYSDFLDTLVAQTSSSADNTDPRRRMAAKGFSEAYQNLTMWYEFFVPEEGTYERDMINLEAAIPLSYFPVWDIKKESKTEKLCYIPVSDEHDDEFRHLFRALLRKYAPEKLFVPPSEACHKVGSKKYNDAGEVKYDYQSPEKWDSGFLYQSFLTGPLTLREVWLPDKQTKDSNQFWFVIYEQIIKKIPYYANNYTEPEALHNSIKDKLKGHAVSFDVSGFGLQFYRKLLRIAIEETLLHYNVNVEMIDQRDRVNKILDNVILQMPNGEFKYPTRGIGLGYFENLKTLCVCAILDHTNPISLFGDQGLIPFSLKLRKNHPKALLEKFGFVFLPAVPPKVHIISDIQTGVLFGGLWMTPDGYEVKKGFLPQISGALSGEFHWERKAAIESLSLPTYGEHIRKYISFQYEIVFGHEFYAGEGMAHYRDLGINHYAQPSVGEVEFLDVYSLQPPKSDFDSFVSRSAFPTRKGVPQGVSKKFSLKRREVYNHRKIRNSYDYEYVNPRVTLNNDKKVSMSYISRVTPFWMSARMLFLTGLDTGTISNDLADHAMRRAIAQYPFAENPYKVKATGGYHVDSLYVTPMGPSQEMNELNELIINSDKAYGKYVWKRSATNIPLSFSWDYGVKQDRVKNILTRVEKVSPALRQQWNPYLAAPEHVEPQPTLDLSDLKKMILQSLEREEDVNISKDFLTNWEGDIHVDETSDYAYSIGDVEDENYLDEEYLTGEYSPVYRPESPSGSLPEEASTWIV